MFDIYINYILIKINITSLFRMSQSASAPHQNSSHHHYHNQSGGATQPGTPQSQPTYTRRLFPFVDDVVPPLFKEGSSSLVRIGWSGRTDSGDWLLVQRLTERPIIMYDFLVHSCNSTPPATCLLVPIFKLKMSPLRNFFLSLAV